MVTFQLGEQDAGPAVVDDIRLCSAVPTISLSLGAAHTIRQP